MNRRNFIVSLFAPLVAKWLPKIGDGKPVTAPLPSAAPLPMPVTIISRWQPPGRIDFLRLDDWRRMVVVEPGLNCKSFSANVYIEWKPNA